MTGFHGRRGVGAVPECLAERVDLPRGAGKVMAADVAKLDGQKVKTVQCGELTVGVDGDKVTLTDAAGNTVDVTATDVEASNGLIHVIDGVLMPK